MTQEQEDAIFAAYLGICVLQTMTRKVRLQLAASRCEDVIVRLSTAFPFIAERVARSMLRQEHQS